MSCDVFFLRFSKKVCAPAENAKIFDRRFSLIFGTAVIGTCAGGVSPCNSNATISISWIRFLMKSVFCKEICFLCCLPLLPNGSALPLCKHPLPLLCPILHDLLAFFYRVELQLRCPWTTGERRVARLPWLNRVFSPSFCLCTEVTHLDWTKKSFIWDVQETHLSWTCVWLLYVLISPSSSSGS